MVDAGFYIVSDDFFNKVNDPGLMGNDQENRPHCFCFEKDGFYWMIPMSSQVTKYKAIIQNKLSTNKPCDILHVAILDDGKESAFLIQNIFPVTIEFVKREYTIGTNHLRVTSESLKNEIIKKAYNVIKLLEKGIKLLPNQQDIKAIKEKLVE